MKPGLSKVLSKRGLLVSVVAAGVVAGGGAAAFAAGPNGDGDKDAPAKASVTAVQAADAVQKAAPGVIEELELDDEKGRTVWEADVLTADGTWREVTLDANDGKVISNEVPRPDKGDEKSDGKGAEKGDAKSDDGDAKEAAAEAEALKAAKTTAAQAAGLALEKTPGTVTSVEFDDGSWEVEVVQNGAEHELKLDPASGKVLADSVDED
ncbi:PepSY domain-containing protein [Actinomadura xylanilytica]|uniref:PepSY domain-containing protein n=1 Tax=Actinomadura xylanilytica TaxID=887459 RepID=UPI00255B051B|nr:PepSY domain-containing protein [Actinomadura xylanilytica]MDL4772773.1 PepSY domain-containing protein [Actinomadura xylanilytica]